MSKLMTTMYHFVMDATDDFPLLKTLCIADFRGQLDYLTSNHIPLTLADVRHSILEGKELPKNGFLLTFDHGTRDHIDIVMPELLRRGLEGTFYVMTSVLECGTIPSIDKGRFLEGHFKKYSDFLKVFCDQCMNKFPALGGIATPTKSNIEKAKNYLKRFKFYSDEERYFRWLRDTKLNWSDYNSIINNCFIDVFGSEIDFAKQHYLTVEDVAILLDNGMQIGSHGHNHIIYSRHGKEECGKDLKSSIDYLLSTFKNHVIDTVAYPNGGYGSHLSETLLKLKITACFSTDVSLDFKVENRFQLPRLDTQDIPMKDSAKKSTWSQLLNS